MHGPNFSKSISRAKRTSVAPSAYRRLLNFEPLEDRCLLSVSMDVASRAASFPVSAGGSSGNGVVASPDGRYIAYGSNAANLANGWLAAPENSDTNPNDVNNIYRYDRVTGETVLVSMNETGNGVANADCSVFWMSADGNKVIFNSQATNLNPLDIDDSWDTYERNIATGTTTLLNVNSGGTTKIAANISSMSADGNLIVLETAVPLSPLDNNSFGDVYVRNLALGTDTLASVNTTGTGAANRYCGWGRISANGRVVSFTSEASNLDPHDTNAADQRGDLYARDLVTGTTQLVSIKASGTGINEYMQSIQISTDGRYVVFDTSANGIVAADTNNQDDVFVRDLVAGTTQWVSQGHSWGDRPVASANGNVVVYLCFPQYGSQTVGGLFAYDLTTHATTMLLVSNDVDGYSVSADGSKVAFNTRYPLDNRHDVYLYSFSDGTTRLVSKDDQGSGGGNSDSGGGISADGSTVLFVGASSNIVPGDWNGASDVFAYDVASDQIELVSKAAPGLESRTASLDSAVWASAASADGRYVAFTSRSPNLVNGLNIAPSVENAYRYDRVTGKVELASINKTGDGSGNGDSNYVAISADGNVVAFISTATNLSDLDADTLSDIYAHNFTTNTTKLVTINSAETGAAHAENQTASLSADGHRIAFQSRFPGIDPLDTNSVADIFVHDLTTHTTNLASINAAGTGSGNGPSTEPSLSSDGTKVAFLSSATNLSLFAAAGGQIYVRDLTTGLTQLVSTNSAGTGGGNGASTEPVISGNGNVVAFISAANNLAPLSAGNNNMYPNVFARNLTTGVTYFVSVNSAGNGIANDYCYDAHISADGRVVVYSTHATNIDPRDTDWEQDIFARDVVAGHTYFVSDDTSAAGSNDNDGCYNPVISSDGNTVAFSADVNSENVLVHNLLMGTTQLVSISRAGPFIANDGSQLGSINADGSVVAFTSYASDLVDRDYNNTDDAFVAAISWSTPPLAGDYNGDGVVDSADYVVWQRTAGTIVVPYSVADGNGNGVVNQDDYLVWRSHFGDSLPPAARDSGTIETALAMPALSTEADLLTNRTTTWEAAATPTIHTNLDTSRASLFDAIALGPQSVSPPRKTGGSSRAAQPANDQRQDVALIAWLDTIDSRSEELELYSESPMRFFARESQNLACWELFSRLATDSVNLADTWAPASIFSPLALQ